MWGNDFNGGRQSKSLEIISIIVCVGFFLGFFLEAISIVVHIGPTT